MRGRRPHAAIQLRLGWLIIHVRSGEAHDPPLLHSLLTARPSDNSNGADASISAEEQSSGWQAEGEDTGGSELCSALIHVHSTMSNCTCRDKPAMPLPAFSLSALSAPVDGLRWTAGTPAVLPSCLRPTSPLSACCLCSPAMDLVHGKTRAAASRANLQRTESRRAAAAHMRTTSMKQRRSGTQPERARARLGAIQHSHCEQTGTAHCSKEGKGS